jgi:hypothetical protein
VTHHVDPVGVDLPGAFGGLDQLEQELFGPAGGPAALGLDQDLGEDPHALELGCDGTEGPGRTSRIPGALSTAVKADDQPALAGAPAHDVLATLCLLVVEVVLPLLPQPLALGGELQDDRAPLRDLLFREQVHERELLANLDAARGVGLEILLDQGLAIGRGQHDEQEKAGHRPIILPACGTDPCA